MQHFSPLRHSRKVKTITISGRASLTSIDAQPAARSVAARVIAVRVRSQFTLTPTDNPFSISETSFYWPRSVVSRITSQSGLFSVHPFPDNPWIDPLKAPNSFFDIPGEMRNFFQKRLYYLGINDQMIMGGLDGVGARLRWQYNARTGLGTL